MSPRSGNPIQRRTNLIRRRDFVRGGLALLAWPVVVPGFARAAHHEKGSLGKDTLDLLDRSGFVYISPLRADGAESSCHGEVWYGWLDGAVVINTTSSTWKARGLSRGLDRARIWVGDHGRWKKMIGVSEAFRVAPSFEARASVSRDGALLERLLALYDDKYPAEIGRWRDKMRNGFNDGSRQLIRYIPEV